MIPRVVFDCMVYLQAAGSPGGPAAACLAIVEAGVAELCISDDGLAEIEDVLDRPVTRRQFKTLTDRKVAAFLTRLRANTVRIDPVPAVFVLSRDPKDSKYVDLAAAANATFLVTRDKDLLDLMTGTDPDAVTFRANHPTVTILDPAAFLAVTRPTP